MDYFHTVTKWIDCNRYKFVALILTVVLVATAVGCESQTASIMDPAVRVNRQQLSVETVRVQADLSKDRAQLDATIAIYNADIEATNKLIADAAADLDRQDQVKAELLDLAGSIVTDWSGGGVPTAAIVGTGLTAFGLLFGIGSAADSRRKDKVIESTKKPKAEPISPA